MKDGQAGRLFIVSPAYSATYCAEYVESLVATIKDCQAHGIKTAYQQVNGVHWIDIARDIAAHLFLHSDCEYMLQIDTDLGWQADAARRLMEQDKPVIGGVYPYRNDIGAFPETRNGLPGGFLMVRRDVIEKMTEGSTLYKCAAFPWGELHVAPLFTRIMMADKYIGEDYAFCHRAKEAGFSLWVEPDIEFSHVGLKAWKGNLARAQ